MTTTLPRITHVAVKTDSFIWTLPEPYRHYHILHDMSKAEVLRNYGTEEQGFVTQQGKFLNRRAAMALAQDNGQLKRDPDPKHYQGDELFSEDLW